MHWLSYVAPVAHMESTSCHYGEADEPPGPGAVLLEVLRGNNDVLTFRYTAGGDGVGEVWFRTEEEARQAIAAEFPGGVGPWEPVPADAADPHQYAIRYARAKFGAPEA